MRVTPMFLHMGVILARVSSNGFTRTDTLPSGETYFLTRLRCNDNGFDNLILVSQSNN